MPKRVYTCDETFRAVAEISNYGPKNLPVKPEWTLADESGRTITGSSLPATVAETEKSRTRRNLRPLRTVAEAARLTLTLKAGGTSNSWNIWVYPARQPETPAGVRIAYEYDRTTRDALARGERVLLFSDPTKGLYKIDRVMLGPDEIRLFEVKPGQNALEEPSCRHSGICGCSIR